MEQPKLTIRISKELLDKARRYARAHNTTLTRLISAYLARLDLADELDAPIVRRLSGVLPPTASIEDYQEHLKDKYGQADHPG